jgi:hypothetical protein
MGLAEMRAHRFPAPFAPRNKALRHFVLHEHAPVARERRRVAVLLPRIAAKAQGQVRVLVAILETRVPSADVLECLAVDEDAETGQNVNVVYVGKPPVPVHHLKAHDGVGHRASGQKAAVPARIHEAQEPLAARRESVVIDEQDPRRVALLRQVVVAA